MTAAMEAARSHLVECKHSDWLTDLLQAIQSARICAGQQEAIERQLVRSCGGTRDLGVQPVADARLLSPSPLDRQAREMDPKPASQFRPLTLDALLGPCLQGRRHIHDYLWLRVYSGCLTTEDRLSPENQDAFCLRRILRFTRTAEPVYQRSAGILLACTAEGSRRATRCDPQHPITFEPIHFLQTVVSMAVKRRLGGPRPHVRGVPGAK
jgi:hypothetical protein